jgi:hypothetical protein
MAHIDIVQVVEGAAGIKFTIEEIPELTTLDRLVEAVEQHGGSL